MQPGETATSAALSRHPDEITPSDFAAAV